MAKEYKLEIEKRDSTKKSDLKQYRKEDKIPGVYYSYDSKESINFLVSQSEINTALKSEASIFAINVAEPQDISRREYKELEVYAENFFDYYDVWLDVNTYIRERK